MLTPAPSMLAHAPLMLTRTPSMLARAPLIFARAPPQPLPIFLPPFWPLCSCKFKRERPIIEFRQTINT